MSDAGNTVTGSDRYISHILWSVVGEVHTTISMHNYPLEIDETGALLWKEGAERIDLAEFWKKYETILHWDNLQTWGF